MRLCAHPFLHPPPLIPLLTAHAQPLPMHPHSALPTSQCSRHCPRLFAIPPANTHLPRGLTFRTQKEVCTCGGLSGIYLNKPQGLCRQGSSCHPALRVCVGLPACLKWGRELCTQDGNTKERPCISSLASWLRHWS